ncbi:MAG: GGDEF domain-containing protein [Lachnospiraceae bacterium]
MNESKKLTGKEREAFLQSKYDYYEKFNTWAVILSCLASLSYLFSDCRIFGRIAWETLIPRGFILIPMLIFILVRRRTSNYKIMVPLSYLVIHCVMWCTIWAIYYLPDRQHANEGFIIMHLMFFAVGYCASFYTGTFFHSLVIVNIIVSNLFNHYESFDQMLLLGIPCLVAICLVNYIMEGVYLDHYITKNKLENMLVHDQLTKAYNRNKIYELLNSDGVRLNFPSDQNVCFLLMDIDLFKRVNDTYGHNIGDKVLMDTASIIRSSIRPEDIIIRWGGEEFIVIMPNCLMGTATVIAENIRSNVEAHDNQVCPITVSIGISEYDGVNYNTAVTQADKALYTAKRNGRNQVVCYEESLSTVNQ